MREITAGIFEQAKTYWTVAISAKVLIAAAGIYLTFVPTNATPIAVIVLVFEVISASGFYRAESLKDDAEPILTRLDYEDGLGWHIPQQNVEQYRSDFEQFELRGRKVRRDDPYFSSSFSPGVERLKNNVLESALYTRAIARNACKAVIFVLAISSAAFCALFGSGLYRHFGTNHPSGSELFVSALIFLVTIDLVPLALRYNWFAGIATETRTALTHANTMEAVVPEVIAYQLARSSAPLLPTFTFLNGRTPLAAIWAGSRKKSGK